MLTAIEAHNYRCLRSVRQELGRFHVLVGRNASGKSTFFDVLLFLRSLLSEGLGAAFRKRTPDFDSLLWTDSFLPLNPGFTLSVEAQPPRQALVGAPEGSFDTIRYSVNVFQYSRGHVGITDEEVALIDSTSRPSAGTSQETTRPTRMKPLVFVAHGLDSPRERRVSPENPQAHGYVMRLDEEGSILNRLPSSEFPASLWLRDFLTQSVYLITLDSEALRQPSPATVVRDPLTMGHGEYLPWLVGELRKEGGEARMKEWIAHIQTALPDVVSVRDAEQGDDRRRFLMVKYRNGSELPSWVVSDGTLRLLALTILPYVARPGAVYLVEEPENSLHPHNVETVMQSLQSVYDGQVLVATHSPLVIGLTRPEDILVFARDEHQGSTITVGSEHPGLRDWKGEVNLGTLFAGGVLG